MFRRLAALVLLLAAPGAARAGLFHHHDQALSCDRYLAATDDGFVASIHAFGQGKDSRLKTWWALEVEGKNLVLSVRTIVRYPTDKALPAGESVVFTRKDGTSFASMSK